MVDLSRRTRGKHERTKAFRPKRRTGAIGVVVFFSILLAVFTALQDGDMVCSGTIIGFIILIGGIVLFRYIYSWQKYQQKEK